MAGCCSLPLGLGNDSKWPAQAQKTQLGAFTGGRQAELQLILGYHAGIRVLLTFRARDPWPFCAASGTAWHPLDALVNMCGEFGSYTGSA